GEHGPGDGQRLEHLVLHAAGDPQGRHSNGGASQPGPDIGHSADHLDASDSAKSAHRNNRPAADNEEAGVGTPTMQARPDLGTEPLETVNVRPIIEGADEDA